MKIKTIVASQIKPLAKPLVKPRMRGYFHQEAFFVSLGACAMLVAKSSNPTSLIASLIYSLGLLLLFGVSAFYHRVHWQPIPRARMKRVDHCAIFIFIAGTSTPLCLLALSPHDGRQLLILVWTAALFGIFQSLFWVHAPKWLTAVFYVVVGWLIVPYAGAFKESLGAANLFLIAGGGVIYTIGAIFYALKRPNLKLEIFGYHELFHFFTIVAATFHFIVIYQLIK